LRGRNALRQRHGRWWNDAVRSIDSDVYVTAAKREHSGGSQRLQSLHGILASDFDSALQRGVTRQNRSARVIP
jgi:hypothetical protein